MGNNPKEGGQPPHGPSSSLAGSPLTQEQGASPVCPPKTHPPSPYLAAVGAQGGGDGRAGEGEADSFGFSQLAKARAEPAAPLPAEPGQGTEPAAGGAPQPGSSTMALTAPAWPIWLPASARPGSPAPPRSPSVLVAPPEAGSGPAVGDVPHGGAQQDARPAAAGTNPWQ